MVQPEVITLVLAGAFIGLLGILIKYAGWVELIGGYDPERVADEEGLADFVGTHVLYISLLTIACGVGLLAVPETDPLVVWIVLAIGVTALVVRLVGGTGRYMREPPT